MQSITEDWADGAYTFRLAYGQWIELQRLLDKGPLELLEDMISRKWRVGQSREVIRLGLIGAGMAPAQALALVRTYVEQRPAAESVPLASRILEAGLWAPPKDAESQPGESPAGTAESGGSTPLSFTETEPS